MVKSLQTSKIKAQRSNFDLSERSAIFGESTIAFCKTLRVDHVSKPIVAQLVRSSTSIGANYSEADNSSSRKDYRNKVSISKKEAQETKYWLRMLTQCYPEHKFEIELFSNEVQELIKILQSISNKVSDE